MTDLFKLGLRAAAEAVREGRRTSVQLKIYNLIFSVN